MRRSLLRGWRGCEWTWRSPRRGEVGELDFDLVLADRDPLDHVFDDLPLLIEREIAPTAGEISGFGEDLVERIKRGKDIPKINCTADGDL